MNLAEYEKLFPRVKLQLAGKELVFYTPTQFIAWRAKTLLTKEPTTIEWIDTMSPGERLLDIGANVGGYTVYAARLRGVGVDAIEPEAQNFAILCRNVQLNKVAEHVRCWPIAVSDRTCFDQLYLSDDRPGGSCHSFGEEVDFRLQPKKFPLRQGCYATTVDALVSAGVISPPDYIKLDVDGLEPKVIAGALETLRGGGVKSLSIEVNPSVEQHRALVSTLEDLGFVADAAQVERARRKSGTFEGVAEYIFVNQSHRPREVEAA